MSPIETSRPITRDDIEAKLRDIQASASVGADAARGAGMSAAIVGLLLAIVVAYLLGRRRGKKRRTVVEIRRV